MLSQIVKDENDCCRVKEIESPSHLVNDETGTCSPPANEIEWITCRKCKGEIGVPQNFIGDRVDCPGCGLTVQLSQTVFFRSAAPPPESGPQNSDRSTQSSLGAEIRVSKMIGRLEELAGAQDVFKDACANERDLFGPLLLLCVVLFLVVCLIVSIVPPSGRLAVFIVLLIVSAGSTHCAYQFLKRLKQGRIAKTEFELGVCALTLSENYPDEVESWGGAKTLYDPKLVATVLRGLRSQLALSNRGPEQTSRGGLILGLGIAGLLFPFFAIIAWAMGNSDLEEMEAGARDQAGKAHTESGRTLGKIGTLIYGALIGIIFLVKQS